MSSAPTKSLQSQVLDHYQTWAHSLAESLILSSGPAPQFEVLPQAPAEAPPQAESDIWLMATFTGPLQGQLAFRMAASTARRLAGEKEEAGGSVSAESQSTVLEFFRKAAASFSATSGAAGQEMRIQVDIAAAPSWSASPQAWLMGKRPAPILLEVSANDTLLAGLQRGNVRSSPAASPVDTAPNKLGMLMDVELEVTMRFGGRRMLLKDILDLCTGSVVELDQQVQEPVDLLLDGKMIARGEVVVIDGNYGFRVTELLSRAEH
jgi:flagellar motor switch protein FliN